jgi:hypothetical protein
MSFMTRPLVSSSLFCSMRMLVPFGRPRQQLAVFIASGDVGEDDRRQRAGVMQAFAAPVDAAVLGEFAQHAIERRAVGVLGAELARDLARGDLTAPFADKGDKFFTGGQAFHRRHMTSSGPILGRNRGVWRVT